MRKLIPKFKRAAALTAFTVFVSGCPKTEPPISVSGVLKKSEQCTYQLPTMEFSDNEVMISANGKIYHLTPGLHVIEEMSITVGKDLNVECSNSLPDLVGVESVQLHVEAQTPDSTHFVLRTDSSTVFFSLAERQTKLFELDGLKILVSHDYRDGDRSHVTLFVWGI